MNVYASTYLYVRIMCVHVCMYVCVCVHVCMCVCVCVFVCISLRTFCVPRSVRSPKVTEGSQGYLPVVSSLLFFLSLSLSRSLAFRVTFPPSFSIYVFSLSTHPLCFCLF